MQKLEEFSKLKKLAINSIDELAKFPAGSLQEPSEQLIQEIQQDKLTVAVVGVIKRGKSTLLNAILKAPEDILSTNVTPETARLSFLNYADRPSAIIHTKSNQQIPIPIEQIHEYTSAYNTTNPNGRKDKVDDTLFAEIFYPNEILSNGISIVDTPGTEDPDETRSKVTLEFINQADVVIFVLSAIEGGLKESELKLLQHKILSTNGSGKGAVFAINKIGLLRRHQLPELDKLIKNNQDLIRDKFRVNIPIFPIDSKSAIDGHREQNQRKIEASRFDEFLLYLQDYLLNNKGKILLKHRLSKFLKEYLVASLQECRESLSQEPKTIKELQEQLEKEQQRLKELEIRAKKILEKLKRDSDALKSSIERKVRESFNAMKICPEQMSNLAGNLNRAVATISDQTSSKMRSILLEIQEDFNESKLNILVPDFDVTSISLNASNYTRTEEKVIKGSNKGAIIGGIVGGVLGSIFSFGILSAAGAFFGGLVGSFSDEEDKTIKEIKFDSEALRRDLKLIQGQTESNLLKYVDVTYSNILKDVTQKLKRKEQLIKQNYKEKEQIIFSEKKSFEDYKFHQQTKIDFFNNRVLEIESILQEIEKI